MARVVVGVDGGNSKTDVAVADEAGRVLAVVQGGGSSPGKLGVAGALQVITDLVDEALDRAGVPSGTAPAGIATFLAGLDLPEDAPAFHRALATAYPDVRLVVGNDIDAVLLAGTGGRPGAAVVCGAGINAVGRSATGERVGFLSLGLLSGDWGGGISIGRDILFAAVREEDGRGEATAMTPAVRSHFGVDRVADVTLAIHRGKLAEIRLAELVPTLFEADDAGDATARTIVDRVAREVAGMARVMLQRCRLLDVAAPVVLAGGVVTSGHERLLRMISAHLAASAPRAELRHLDCLPVAGALIAAWDSGSPGAGTPPTAPVPAFTTAAVLRPPTTAVPAAVPDRTAGAAS